ncbi:MAG TPA: CHAT domain-containing protein [Solirubrobacteraceae bacterium]|nr:CHAT domain-containing protein [Solirubrobacteraceae bacterium]
MTVAVAGDDALELAQAAFELVESDASAAALLAQRALDAAHRRRDAEAEVAALHALSFAQHELGDDRAIRTIRRAVRAGERHGLARRTALARRRLALDLAGRGAITGALRELELAYAALDPHERARSEVFRVAVLWYAGTTTEPLTGTEAALATLREHGDAFWEAQLLRNRGGVLAERGQTVAAERDLVRARDLFAELGATSAALAVETELARTALIRGDLPECLARLDAIDTRNVSPRIVSELSLLRAQATAAARLRGEALAALSDAEEMKRRSGRDDHGGRLEAIRLMLLAGNPTGARTLALQTQRSFAAQGRRVYGARAAVLALAASIAAGAVRPSSLRSGRRAGTILAGAGWHGEARRAQLMVARAAIELGSPAVARRELSACSVLLRRGPLADRIEAWHVEALLRLNDGDRAGAERALRTGLRLLEGYRETLGASDLRATASEIGVELAELGLRTALAGARADSMLAWADRLRGSALRLPPVTPPDLPELRDRGAELRLLSAEIWRADRRKRTTRTLLGRQAALEGSIRRLSRHAAGGPAPGGAPPGRRELSRSLGGRALVELIELDGRLTALTLTGGLLERDDLGAVEPVREELEWLRFALVRLARRGREPAQRATMRQGAEASAERLGELLVEPLAHRVGERPLVIVPTGALHSLPWAMIPQLRGRPIVVAPSATTWSALQSPSAGGRSKVALVAGPRLRHARGELEALDALYSDTVPLAGKDATVAAVMEALDGATVAHLACHGHFRADSPLFSSLELADGPLNAYELQRLRRPPELIVLSACDLATSDTRPGDELLGYAAALIGIGTRTIIASVVPVPDAGAKRLMTALHTHLTTGDPPSVALAKAQAGLSPRGYGLAGFACLGTG